MRISYTHLRYFFRIVGVFAVLGAVGCARQAPSLSEEDGPPNRKPAEGQDLYGLLRQVHFDYEPYVSNDAMAADADLVVTAVFVEAREGRRYASEEYDPEGIGGQTLVLVGKVVEVEADQPSTVFIEYPWPGAATEDELNAALMDDEHLLYLIDVTDLERPGVKFVDDRRGIDEDARIYQLVGPQGMAVKGNKGQVVQPLADQAHWIVKEFPRD